MSGFTHELITPEGRTLYARDKKNKLLAIIFALFGLGGGRIEEPAHFPTTLGLDKRSPGHTNPINPSIFKETNDPNVISRRRNPNGLTGA